MVASTIALSVTVSLNPVKEDGMTQRAAPLAILLTLLASFAFGQTDPGVRAGVAAGGPLSSVAANIPATILNFFNDGKDRFSELDSVSVTLAGEEGVGLGPRYNSRSCAFCHAQPAVGGSAPASNPQIADATADGATNTIPTFITGTGPVREARFIFFFDPNGNPDTTRP